MMKTPALLFFALFAVCFLSETQGRRFFYRGKWFGKKNGQSFLNEKLPSDAWFEQKLDHSSLPNTKTWKQRYFTNATFFDGTGPVFLMIGGEGTAQPIWMVEGMWIKWAEKYKALCFQLEHRFYGKSHPTKNLSTKNLYFLSSEQALADLAYFIEAKSEEYKLKGNKWIVFGGSYPGSLAAWFRMKYPHLAYGAVASSAPLLAQIDFKEYLAVVRDALETSKQGKECTAAIRSATEQLREKLTRPDCCGTLEKSFRLCDPVDPSAKPDVSNLYETLTGNFEGVVQYNKDNRDFEGAKGTNITIDVVCDVMTDSKYGEALDRYAVVSNMILDSQGEKCLDFTYEKFLKEMRAIDWNSSASEGGRQWTYQTCTEFGYFQSSDLKEQPFGDGFPVDFFVGQCSDIFGSRFDRALLESAIKRTNIIYGALNLQATRIVLPNGSIDPWHALGITDSSSMHQAVFINGTAHCADMYPPSDKDSEELIEARRVIEKNLDSWILE